MAKPGNTAAMTPFLFDRTFDRFGEENSATTAANPDHEEPQDAPEAEPAPPAVTFSEEEMTAAKQDSYMDGHADGFREGHAEAMDTLEGQLNELLSQLAPMVSDLGIVQQQANDRAQANMARIVQAMTAKLMPVYDKHHGAEEAMAVISECLTEMQDPGRLMVTLSEETSELLGDRLTKAAESSGFEGQIRMLTDPDMGPSDVRVDWGAGGAQRKFESIRQEVDTFIDRAVARIEEELDAALQPENSPSDGPQSDAEMAPGAGPEFATSEIDAGDESEEGADIMADTGQHAMQADTHAPIDAADKPPEELT